MIRKCIILSLLITMILSLSACGLTEAGVTFPGSNLEAAIREAINKPEGQIYTSDLEELTSLDASYRKISDLTGLEHCANLSILGFQGNQISDISPLLSLTNLEGLNLINNPLSTESVDVYIPQLQERIALLAR